MKKLIASLTLAIACSVQAQTNIVATTNATVTAGWVAPVTVTATAVGNRIRSFSVSIAPNGTLTAIINWEWVDAQGKIVRNGTTRYTGAQLDNLLKAKGASLDMFKQLFTAIAAEETVAPANQ